MFTRPFFPSTSLFSSPSSRSSWFDDDPFFDEWNELLNQQYQQQRALRQRMQQQQHQQQPTRRIQPKDPQQSQQPPSTTTSTSSTSNEQQAPTTTPPSTTPEQKLASCEASCNKECNNNNCATTCATKCQTNCNNNNKDKQVVSSGPSSGNGTVTPARSFWDLASFPSWSGLTSQSIRLEWSGTEPSAKEYVVSAYLPDGITPADVTISMDERTRMLTLKCQTKYHEEEKDKDGNIISSRSSSSFSQRSLQLPQDVDINAISASKNQSAGANVPQLLLHLPKLAAPAPQPGVKQIAIN